MKEKDNSEERILIAAKKVFVLKGMAGARMQDIADEAGINKALLHYYFRSKEKLFEVIFQEAAQRLFPRINLVFESDVPLFVLNEMSRDADKFLTGTWGKQNIPRPEKFLQQIEQEQKKGHIGAVSP